LHHFGIGNESWGCGGGMTPEYYTSLYKHWSVFLRTPWDYPIKTQWIASGGHGYGDDVSHGGLTEWSDYLTANIKPDFLLGFNGVSFHYYTHPKGSVFAEKGSAIGFTEQEWISTIANTVKMDGFLAANRKVMDKHDPANAIALYVDEWGAWYDPAPNTNPAFLQQAVTLRDAIVSALNFHIFHRHAERVKMASPAQLVNVLQAPILTQGKQMVLTPTYHAFSLYTPFQNATRLEMDLGKVPDYKLGKIRVPAISATAALSEEHGIVLGLVNIDPNREHRITVSIANQTLEEMQGQLLTAKAMDTENSFATPNAVRPVPFQAKVVGNRMQLTLPPKSILVLKQR
jgi:alpha-N-arabinofuranosidase